MRTTKRALLSPILPLQLAFGHFPASRETLAINAQLERRNVHAKSLPCMRAVLVIACCVVCVQVAAAADSGYKPKRINKAIELLEQKQPTYYTYGAGGI